VHLVGPYYAIRVHLRQGISRLAEDHQLLKNESYSCNKFYIAG